jgi:hypothetical protein
MTDTPAPPKLRPIPKPNRGWSTKTLAKRLAEYVRTNDISKDEKVSDLFESLKRSIVSQEVGTSLDL